MDNTLIQTKKMAKTRVKEISLHVNSRRSFLKWSLYCHLHNLISWLQILFSFSDSGLWSQIFHFDLQCIWCWIDSRLSYVVGYKILRKWLLMFWTTQHYLQVSPVDKTPKKVHVPAMKCVRNTTHCHIHFTFSALDRDRGKLRKELFCACTRLVDEAPVIMHWS